jgi:hypothetical protein
MGRKSLNVEPTGGPGGKIALPEIAGELATGEQIRIVLMWDPDGADGPWQTAASQRFSGGVLAEDAIYAQLMDDSATR